MRPNVSKGNPNVWISRSLQSCACSCRFSLNDSDMKNALNDYKEEFKLWATMANLKEYALHSYWRDANSDDWLIRSDKCLKMIAPKEGRSRQLCKECCSLGGSHSVVRSCIRFAEKYHAAEILSIRLFHGREATAEAMEEISKTEPSLSSKQPVQSVFILFGRFWDVLDGFGALQNGFTYPSNICWSMVIADLYLIYIDLWFFNLFHISRYCVFFIFFLFFCFFIIYIYMFKVN